MGPFLFLFEGIKSAGLHAAGGYPVTCLGVDVKIEENSSDIKVKAHIHALF